MKIENEASLRRLSWEELRTLLLLLGLQSFTNTDLRLGTERGNFFCACISHRLPVSVAECTPEQLTALAAMQPWLRERQYGQPATCTPWQGAYRFEGQQRIWIGQAEPPKLTQPMLRKSSIFTPTAPKPKET